LRSSRGAMRGTSGGAPNCLSGGFATVAISVGPFVCSVYPRISKCTWPNLRISSNGLSVCCKLPGARNIGIAARHRTEMHELVALAQWNRKRFIHMHAAHGVAHESPRTPRLRRCGGSSSVLLRHRTGVFQQRTENPAKKPHAPRNHEQPKQKPPD